MGLSVRPRGAARGVLRFTLMTGIVACIVLTGTATGYAAPTPSFSRTNYSVGRGPTNVAAADVNEDGNVDLVVTNATDSTFSVLFGDGTGGFGLPVTFAGGGTSPYGLAVADLNRDGHKDVVVANRGSNSASILLGDGKGSFTLLRSLVTGAQPICVKAVDLNENGALDLVVCHVGQTWVATYFGDGKGGFTAATKTYTSANGATDIGVGDLNEDGHLDIAIAHLWNQVVTVLYGDGTGALKSPFDTLVGPNPLGVTCSDLNGDGHADLAVASDSPDYANVLLGNGSGRFLVTTASAIGGWAWAIAVADLNLDGIKDLATANYDDGNLSLLTGVGNGTFAPQSQLALGVMPRYVTASDLNGDGKPDLVVPNYGSNSVSVLLNTTSTSTVDTVPPVTTQSGADGAWHNAPVSVSFTASDDRSGVKSTEYRLDGGAWTTGTSVSVSGDGVHALDYRSTDNAGNVEATKSVQVNIGVPPSPTEHAWDLVAVGKYAYLADGAAGLKVYDISNPASPTLAATCDTPGTAKDVSVVGRYAYVADGASGLQVVDVGDPTRPRIVGTLTTPSSAEHVTMSLGRLYEDFETTSGWITDGGTLSLDTSNVKHGSGALRLTAAAGGLAQAHKDNLGWDLSRDKNNLQLWIYVDSAGANPGSYSRYARISLSNANNSSNYFTIVPNLHEGWNQLRLNSADWQAVGAPSWQKPIQRLTIAAPAPSDSVATISFDELRGGVTGLAPAFLWTFDDGFDEVYTQVLPYLSARGQRGTMYLVPNFVGKTSYVTLPHVQTLYDAGWAIGNHTIDHTDLSTVDQATAKTKIQQGYDWLVSHGFTRAARHLAYPYNHFSDSAFAAAAQAGVLTARRGGYRNTPLPLDDPLLLCSFSFDDSTQTVDAWKSMIDSALASGSTLVFYGHYFDATTYPVFQGIADYLVAKGVWCPPIDEWWNTLVAESSGADGYAGRYAYVSCGSAGLQIIDVGDPASPKLVGSIASAGSSTDVAADDSYALVADDAGGLQVVNALNPASPSRAGGAATSGPARGIAVAGSRGYVAEGTAGLEVFSLKTPSSPTRLGGSDTPGDARDVAVSGAYAYVADGAAGVRIISIANPAAPVEVANRQVLGEAEAVFAMRDYIYVAAGSAGLQVVPALSP